MARGIVPPTELAIAWQTDLDSYPRGERRSNAVIVIATVLLFTTLWVLALRLWARLKVQSNAGLDDGLIVLATIPTVGLSISIILGHIYYGFDRHAWELTMLQGFETREISFAISILYVISTGLTKVSILCFHRRLSDTISRRYLFALHAAIAFIIAYMITFTITLCVGCRPLQAFWRQLDPRWRARHKFECFDEAADILAASAVSLFQDIIACGLPLLIMWQLSIPKRQKIALTGVFGLGIFLCIVGAIRIYYIYKLYYNGSYDATWAAGHIWIWTAVEACLGICCSSAPALKVFFRKALGGTSADGSTSYSHGRSRSFGLSSRHSGAVSRTGRWSHLSSKIRGSDMDFVDASTASGGDAHSINSTTTSELNHMHQLHSISELEYNSPKKTIVAESIQEIDEEGLLASKDEECRIGSLQWVVATPKNAVPGKFKPFPYSASEPPRDRPDTLETSSMSKKSTPSLQTLRSGRSQQNIGSASPKSPAAVHLRTSTDSYDRPHPPPPPTCSARHYNQTHLPPIRPPPPHTSSSSTSPSTTSSPKKSTDRPHPPPSCTARHYKQTHLPPIRPPPPHSSSSLASQSTASSPAAGTGTKSSLSPITPSPPQAELLEEEGEEGNDSYGDVVEVYNNSPTLPPAPAESPSFNNWPHPVPTPDAHRQVQAQPQPQPQLQSQPQPQQKQPPQPPQQQQQQQPPKHTYTYTNTPQTTITPTALAKTTKPTTTAPPGPPPRRSISGDTMLMDADALFNDAVRAADLEIAEEEKKKALAAAAAAQGQSSSATTTPSAAFGQSLGQRDMYARRGALPGGEELCSGLTVGTDGRWGGKGGGARSEVSETDGVVEFESEEREGVWEKGEAGPLMVSR